MNLVATLLAQCLGKREGGMPGMRLYYAMSIQNIRKCDHGSIIS